MPSKPTRASRFGLARSLAIYYGIPLRARRMARFYSKLIAAGDLCFDIGAHAGNRIRCWRRLGARAVAVEPQADFVRLLERLYGRDEQVAIVAAAVGAAAGTARLHVSARTPTVSTVSQEWIDRVRGTPGFRGVAWSVGEEVPMTTLQRLIEQYGEPRFVKIDVEGYEHEVLEGLHTPVRSLSFEYLPAARDLAFACVERLAALGDYHYNWSSGESHRFGAGQWLDPDDIRRFIERLPEEADSGDIYARLGV